MPRIRFGYTLVGCHTAIRLKCCLTKDNRKAIQNQFSDICIFHAKTEGEFIIEGCIPASSYEHFRDVMHIAKLKSKIEILQKAVKLAEDDHVRFSNRFDNY